jgi:uncharacterized protein YprB with RNaseH-like and TPR domain
MDIKIGSIVYGKGGVGNPVTAINNDMLTINTPSWEPTTSVKPYEELTKLYIDIETTGLDPLVDRVLMVGVMNETGSNGRSTSDELEVVA